MKGRFGWEHHDKPVYWSLPDDGAPIKCQDCKKQFAMKDVILAQSPDDKRGVYCKECIDEDWLASATFLGSYAY